MKIVIDIPEEEYRIICKEPFTIIGKAIKNGALLPKGHGTREEALDDVLKILDRYYLWHYEESIGEYVTVGKEIEDRIKALKGGKGEVY